MLVAIHVNEVGVNGPGGESSRPIYMSRAICNRVDGAFVVHLVAGEYRRRFVAVSGLAYPMYALYFTRGYFASLVRIYGLLCSGCCLGACPVCRVGVGSASDSSAAQLGQIRDIALE
jgi:hypothetical protein